MGSVSEREVWQAAMKAQAALVTDGDETFATALHRFTEKLAKRSRRVQASARVSLTDTSLLPVDIHNREEASLADPRLSAWTNGKTGFPLLDASMRCLQATGHLESSLRSLLLSFATCHLWLGPVRPAQVLAQLCTDFAPAMYYGSANQVIGLSKAAPPCIPNPVRQSLSRDPDGAFIRKWIPEIAELPDQYLHAPWEAPKSALSAHGIILGQSYPMPLVDHVAAAREAKRRLSPDGASRPLPFHSIARKPLGIRRSTIGRNMTAKRSGHSPIQLSFDLQSQA
jgi:deoxyribodipyrimidine photo-lyase